VAGNRGHGHAFHTGSLQSPRQTTADVDLRHDVAFGLASQQGARARVRHHHVKIPTGARQRIDQTPLVEVSSGGTDADNQSDVRV
jgi:hypothetical protein